MTMRHAFGDCVFDRGSRELTRGGALVHAGPKLLRALELLLDARPNALTKDEIHRTLWSGTFVSDATLTSLVADLRAAIGDDARAPRLVRTIHGYGYVFCGDVAEVSRANDEAHEAKSYRLIVGTREIALTRGEHVLGRSGEAVIAIDDAGVSRVHARITIRPRTATLADLGSKNGTTLNGVIIDAPTELVDGSVIGLGATLLTFRVCHEIGSTETLSITPPNATHD